MRSRRDAVAVALFVLAGCAATRFETTPHRRATRRAVAPPAWEVIVLPPTSDPAVADAAFRAGLEPDGTQDLVAGAVRAGVSRGGEAIAWARDATLQPLRAAVRDGELWYFASADGGLFRAEGFTGALTRLGDTGGHAVDAVGCEGAGMLTVVADDEALWPGGGAREAMRPAPAPLDHGLIAAGFLDRTFGVAVVAPGRVFRTLDGGERFELVDTGGSAPMRVALDGDAFVLETTGGLLRVGPSGDATPFAGASPARDRAVPPEALGALQDGLLADYPLAFANALGSSGAMLGDGRAAVRDHDDVVLVSPRGASRLALPGLDCDVLPWGTQVLAACRGGDGVELFASDGERAWSSLRRFATEASVVAGVGGTTLAVAAPCDDAPAPLDRAGDEVTPVCWFDGASWRERVLPGAFELVALAGDRVLCVAGRGADDGSDGFEDLVRVARLSDEDRPRPVALALPGASLQRASLGNNGLVAGVALRGARRYAAVGTLAQPLALRPLPDEARDVAFVDSQRGLAVGARLDQVFATVDGARTWTRLALPVDGDAASVQLPRDELEDPSAPVVCSSWACVVGAQLVWTAPSSSAYAPTRIVAAAHAPRAVDDVDDDDDALHAPLLARERAARWLCAAASPSHRGPHAAERAYGGGGWLEARAGFAWGGLDARGPFRATARGGLRTVDGAADAQRLLPRALTRELAVFERCAVRGGGACELGVAPRGGAARIVGREDALLDAQGARVLVRGALALPDGGAVVHLAPLQDESLAPTDDAARVDAVLRFDARGVLVARRGFAWGRAPVTRLLALGPDGPGLVAMSPGSPSAVTFHSLVPASEPRAWGALAPRTMPACAGEPGAASGALRVLTEGTSYGPRAGFVANYVSGALRAVLELDGRGAACLRAMDFWSEGDREANDAGERELIDRVGGTPSLEADHGRLAGRAFDGEHVRTIVCRGGG